MGPTEESKQQRLPLHQSRRPWENLKGPEHDEAKSMIELELSRSWEDRRASLIDSISRAFRADGGRVRLIDPVPGMDAFLKGTHLFVDGKLAGVFLEDEPRTISFLDCRKK